VLSISWMSINVDRVSTAHQMLAVSVFPGNIDDDSSLLSSPTNPSLVQIWDFGCLSYKR